MADARYVVGIDLGTTNTVVAYADLSDRKRARSRSPARSFDIEQRVGASAVEARPLLPSTLYAPVAGEIEGDARFIVGVHARTRGVEVPGRVVTSAKSWLAHGGVDRTADILPWGAGDPEEDAKEATPRISPVDAQAAILAHVRDAWNRAFPEAPLADQSIVLTVPASFDEVARALTIEATKRAEFPEGSVRLLEEPQAAFLDWARVAGDAGLREVLGDAESRDVLVCDVGGGTSDFSLIRVARAKDEPGGLSLRRIAVGDHLLLGGDNMDVALAHLVEPRLSKNGDRLTPARFAQLTAACRAAKEQLLSPSGASLKEVTVTLVGAGSRLIGGSVRATLTREDFDRIVLQGFFPIFTKQALAELHGRRARAGLVSFGLPYASDPAITRHLASFLERSRSSSASSASSAGSGSQGLALLLNGGVFHAQAVVARLGDAIEALEGIAPVSLPHADPDLAVARGAVAHGLALRGIGRRVGGGSAHGYYIGVASEGLRRAVCVLPRGAEPEERQVATGKIFALTVGRSARFDLFASAIAEDRPGDVVIVDEPSSLDEGRFVPLAPLVTVVRGDASRPEVRVELQGELTEVGTLELACVELENKREHRLAFELRKDDRPLTAPPPAVSLMPPSMSAPARMPSSSPSGPVSLRAYEHRLDEARVRIDRVFGKPQGNVDPREAKSLVRDLERILGERATWPTAIVRPLFDVLREVSANRRRSADHERVWWSLIGYLMRPGFGDPLDAQRITALAPLLGQGLFFPKEANGWRAWWVAWRRVAGGLDENTQLVIRDMLDPFLAPDDGRPRKKPKNVRPEPWDEVLLLASSLERIPPRRRSELGAWILERTWTAPTAEAATLYVALGRIGARVPAHASAHHVVAPRTAESFLSHVLRADWTGIVTVQFAAVQLARATGDRVRDVSDAVRAEVVKKLEATGARAEWIRSVREVVALDEEQKRELFGEALPLGLRLLE